MFKLCRRTKPEARSAQPTGLCQAVDASPTTYEFVATFGFAASNTRPGGNNSAVYTMCPEDSFAVLRDAAEASVNDKAQEKATAVAKSVPKVIAVMLEPNGQSRFFHPEASRRAGRPIWQPLQTVES